MENKKSRILQLFLTFFKIGAFTFGGGYAMIPLIKEEVVTRRKWITAEDILDIVAIAESTPGPIAINSATFVGYKTAGFRGSFAATAGVSLPSFLIIYAVSFVLRQFENFTAVKYAFTGIRAAILALIAGAFCSMYKASPKGKISYILMAFAFVMTAFFDISVLYIILICGLVGFLSSYKTLKKKGDKS